MAFLATLLVMFLAPPQNKQVNEIGNHPTYIKKHSIIKPLEARVYAEKQQLVKVPTQAPKTAPVASGGSCEAWMAQAGISDPDAVWLIGKESGCEPGRLNKSSLACGIAQALPCTKLYPHATKEWIRANAVTRNGKLYLPNPDPVHELKWMKAYVANRYTTWSAARAWHRSHNWY